MNQSTVLSIKKPTINYMFNYYANMCIAETDEKAVEWLQSSFQQMWCMKNSVKWKILLNKTPFVKQKTKKNIPTNRFKPDEILELVIKLLNDGYYPDIKINWFIFRKNNADEIFSHEILFYGYDLKEQIFYVSGYFPPNAHQISFSTISFEKFLKAFFDIDKTDIRLYKHRDSKKGFSLKKFKVGIRDYYNSRVSLKYILLNNTFTSLTKKYYGLKSHEALRKKAENIKTSEEKIGGFQTTIKGFEQFMEAMVKRLKYVEKKDYFENMEDIISTYEKIYKSYQVMTMLAIKYRNINNPKFLDQIIDLSLKCDEDEKRALEELIKKF